MFVEATRMGGEGKITLTGQLGRSITTLAILSNLQRRENKTITCDLKPERDTVIRGKPVTQKCNMQHTTYNIQHTTRYHIVHC